MRPKATRVVETKKKKLTPGLPRPILVRLSPMITDVVNGCDNIL